MAGKKARTQTPAPVIESGAPLWLDYRLRKGKVRAYRHEGAPKLVAGVESSALATHGDYVVETGTTERTRFHPPANGKPGYYEPVSEPRYEVMKAEDFEALYEPA